MSFSHEGHSHGSSVVASVSFDKSGTLWRVREQQGFVIVDSSNDQGLNFSKSINVNTELQKIGTSGDAKPKIAIGPEGNIYVTWTQTLSKPYTGYIWFNSGTRENTNFIKIVSVHFIEYLQIYHEDGINIEYNPAFLFENINKLKKENKIIGKKMPFKLHPAFAKYYNSYITTEEQYKDFFTLISRSV